MNDDTKSHFGGSIHFRANTSQTSFKGELATYHHQLLGSPTTRSILNVLEHYPAELMSMPGINKDLITRYLEPSAVIAKGHMVRVRKNIRSTHSNRPAKLEARQEVGDLAPMQQMCSAI